MVALFAMSQMLRVGRHAVVQRRTRTAYAFDRWAEEFVRSYARTFLLKLNESRCVLIDDTMTEMNMKKDLCQHNPNSNFLSQRSRKMLFETMPTKNKPEKTGFGLHAI